MKIENKLNKEDQWYIADQINCSTSKLELLFEMIEKEPNNWESKDYYLMKKREIELISEGLDLNKNKSLLEIGGASGFQSALFAETLKSVVALDMPIAPGSRIDIFERASRLIKFFLIKNLGLTIGSGEYIPFADESFDFVYSAYVLEHIAYKKKCP